MDIAVPQLLQKKSNPQPVPNLPGFLKFFESMTPHIFDQPFRCLGEIFEMTQFWVSKLLPIPLSEFE